MTLPLLLFSKTTNHVNRERFGVRCHLSDTDQFAYFCRKKRFSGTPLKLKCLRSWFSR